MPKPKSDGDGDKAKGGGEDDKGPPEGGVRIPQEEFWQLQPLRDEAADLLGRKKKGPR